MKDITEDRQDAVTVTIGMPVRNNARTVARAIASVLAQSATDWRLIVTDDRSGDDTLDQARRAAGGDPRIEICQNPERLGYANFAVALRAAQSPYFVWLAGDDYWAPDFLACTLTALKAASAAVSAVPEAAFVVDGGLEPIPNLDFLRGGAGERVRRYLAHPGGTRMYGLMRTDAAQSAFPSRTVHAYDWYLMVALLTRGPQLLVPSRLLYREKTHWIDYARAEPDGPVLRRCFPVLDISLMLLRDRRIPLTAVPALIALNLRKYEESTAVNRPDSYLRRLPLLRRIGAPIARNPDKLATLAAFHRDAGALAAVVDGFEAARRTSPGIPAATRLPQPAVTVTAIVTCRNAENTLPAWLEHAAALGCRIVVVDHGSTDATRSIAASRLGGQVAEIVDAPFRGYFDLTEQLERKRGILSRVTTDWVWHADADEFLEPGHGASFAELTRAADAAGHVAFACDEAMYLPNFEDEVHAPASFRETMTEPVPMLERDEKQRLFRRTVPLDLWFETGGHSVTHDPALVSPRRLVLSHYVALSLDDLRSQYLARVFAPRDVFKLWHGNRAVSRQFDVVAPGDDPPDQRDKRRLPAFAPRDQKAERPPSGTNLVVRHAQARDNARLQAALEAAVPGLRCWLTTSTDVDAMALPVLSVLSHPARLHDEGLTWSEERAAAAAWLRRIANARQDALDRRTPYAEARLEEVVDGSATLRATIRCLYMGKVATGSDGFIRHDAATIAAPVWLVPVRDITRRLAADLGYR